eukprot:TRINITY_DN23354_c0_g1_i1.p1 TRINITY_DN23354_c0_g1~~TRINITY_DN23354_c0_g1_i1.p1  ORF type:complete len:1288 (-),score=292.56 TRINITY_DN23354_c0_g1_i1:436-4299(-)
MEGVEYDNDDGLSAVGSEEDNTQNIHDFIFSRYKNSKSPEHTHLCAAVDGISQLLKGQNLPENPTSYFAAIMNSLEKIDTSSEDQMIIATLSTLLSLILHKVPRAVLKAKWDPSIKTLVHVVEKNGESQGTVKAGLKNIAFLLCLGHKNDWESISPAFGVVLRYIVDRRPKVRKRAQTCLEDLLKKLHCTSVMAKASEEVQSMLERFLRTAGGSETCGKAEKVPVISNGSNGALEVLHMLNALKFTLPLFSKKAISKLLGHFRLLLQLRKPFLTRHVMNALHALCTSETADIPTSNLAELLCWLCTVVFEDEKSADDIYFATLVLRHGMKKVYDLESSLCTAKLPVVFHALAELLTLQHEAALLGASEALRHLISNCIDDDMVEEGVGQVKLHGDTRESPPTAIERICTTAESLLSYQYSTAWDISLQVVSELFDKLGRSSYYLLGGVVKNLADLQNLSDDDLPSRKQLHKSIGSAVAAMGAENFLSLLPLNLDTKDLSEANVWLLPILKLYTIGSTLRFFKARILPLAERLQSKSKTLEEEGRPVAARNLESCVYSLWSLLPSFCNYPVDTSENFPLLAVTLHNKLSEEPDLRGIICSSLQILIQQNKNARHQNLGNVDGLEESLAVQRAKSQYNTDTASQNVQALASYSPKFLQVLFTIFMSSPEDKRGFVQVTIAEFASISDKKVVMQFFTKIMKKLLEATQNAIDSEQKNSELRAQLLDLAASLVQSLNVDALITLFAAIKPALQDKDGGVQKKAYKVLGHMMKDHVDFLPNKIDEIFEIFVSLTPTSCHLSARRNRLICLKYLIIHMLRYREDMKESIVGFISEILLGVKEANKKTRGCAYDTIASIGHCLDDSENGGSRDKLQKFFDMVAGFLGATTTPMMSAAITALARLVYEFSDICSLVPDLLPSVFILLKTNIKEIIKACLGFIKVAIARLNPIDLQNQMACIVGVLLQLEDKRHRFKAKVRLLLEMMIRKCGLEAVKAVTPERHLKLITNIRKVNHQKEKRKSSSSRVGADETKSSYSDATTTRKSKWNHTDIFSEFGDEDNDLESEDGMDPVNSMSSKSANSGANTKSTARSKNLRKSRKRLPEDSLDNPRSEPLDLLDKQKTRSLLKVQRQKSQGSDSDGEPDVASDGRLVIMDEGMHNQRKKRKNDKNESEDTYSQGQQSRQSKSQGTVTSASKKQSKRQKTSKAGWAYTGAEYTSEKAKGDVKREGKHEPYAYWPLDAKILNRREEKRAMARKGMLSVMKLTKKMEGKSAKDALAVKSGSKKRKQKAHKQHK